MITAAKVHSLPVPAVVGIAIIVGVFLLTFNTPFRSSNSFLGYAINEFESKIYESLGFTKIKELEDNISLYELDEYNINKRH